MPAYSLEENEIGNCSNCDSMLISLSYHSVGETIVVVTKCVSCGAFYVNIYDSDWNWVDEAPVSLLPIPISISNQIIDDWKGLETIPLKKLEAVFSRGRSKLSLPGQKKKLRSGNTCTELAKSMNYLKKYLI